jgi:hypothetical protein
MQFQVNIIPEIELPLCDRVHHCPLLSAQGSPAACEHDCAAATIDWKRRKVQITMDNSFETFM